MKSKEYPSKDMANVKVFADKETNKQTGQKLYALDLSMRGHKKGKADTVHSHLGCQTLE